MSLIYSDNKTQSQNCENEVISFVKSGCRLQALDTAERISCKKCPYNYSACFPYPWFNIFCYVSTIIQDNWELGDLRCILSNLTVLTEAWTTINSISIFLFLLLKLRFLFKLFVFFNRIFMTCIYNFAQMYGRRLDSYILESRC